MEAVWKIEIEDFPAFIVINHEGKDFYADLDIQKAADFIQVSDSGKSNKLFIRKKNYHSHGVWR